MLHADWLLSLKWCQKSRCQVCPDMFSACFLSLKASQQELPESPNLMKTEWKHCKSPASGNSEKGRVFFVFCFFFSGFGAIMTLKKNTCGKNGWVWASACWCCFNPFAKPLMCGELMRLTGNMLAGQSHFVEKDFVLWRSGSLVSLSFSIADAGFVCVFVSFLLMCHVALPPVVLLFSLPCDCPDSFQLILISLRCDRVLVFPLFSQFVCLVPGVSVCLLVFLDSCLCSPSFCFVFVYFSLALLGFVY